MCSFVRAPKDASSPLKVFACLRSGASTSSATRPDVSLATPDFVHLGMSLFPRDAGHFGALIAASGVEFPGSLCLHTSLK